MGSVVPSRPNVVRRARSGCAKPRGLETPPTRSAKQAARPLTSSSDTEVVRELDDLRLRLRVVFATAVTAERALRHLNCEQDVEIADCMRHGISGPIADQVSALARIIERLGGRTRDGLS